MHQPFLSNYTKLSLRPWTLDDVEFSLKVRNHPELMRWFRQDSLITVAEQRRFIEIDVITGHYNGMVIEADGEKAGLCGVKHTGEFTIGVLPEYQRKGISSWAMKQLIKMEYKIWSEVFVGNPALEWFIHLGFKVVDVEERAYYKKGIGLVDTVTIRHE